MCVFVCVDFLVYFFHEIDSLVLPGAIDFEEVGNRRKYKESIQIYIRSSPSSLTLARIVCFFFFKIYIYINEKK